MEINKDLKKVFEAFVGGYLEPSSYYYIFKDKDRFIVKYGYSESGAMVFEDSPELKIIYKSSDEYQDFISNITSMIDQWEEKYVNNKIYDGTQWKLNLLELNMKFYV